MRPKQITAVALTVVLLGAFMAWRLRPEPNRIPEPASPSTAPDRRRGEWPVYGSDKANSKYSPLVQVREENVRELRIAWRWPSPDAAVLKRVPDITPGHYETTPLMVHSVLYASSSLSQVSAIDPVTGRTRWTFDPFAYDRSAPPNEGFVHRGVAYWEHGKDRRIFFATAKAELIALDAETGLPILSLGRSGRVDLTGGLSRPISDRRLYSVTSPPIVCGDLVVVGSSILDYPVRDLPPGDVRAFDARTGALRWVFHTVPQEGEFGTETWKNDSWKQAGAANCWAVMSYDPKLGYLYLPLSSGPNDFYGADRPGDNLFSDSLVCLDATTGRRVWHFQMVHHDLWDYDLPAAPNLVDIKVAGRRISAVAQVSKQGFCYVLDRETGRPVWPIEERPVPASTVPGEASSPTQPFPTRPAPDDRQGLSEEDLIDFTPALRQEALEILKRYHHGPIFTPPALDRPTILLPGVWGGSSWVGAAFDPETGLLYVPSISFPSTVALHTPDRRFSDVRYLGVFGFSLEGPHGLPLMRPPYGRLTAIDLNTGERAWTTPLGQGPRRHPMLRPLHLPPLGWPYRAHLLLTKTLLFAAQDGKTSHRRSARRGFSTAYTIETVEPALQAFDKATGRLISRVALPANASGAPMTYMADGKQYIVVAVGGANIPAELVALSLP
jgi:quinoprotein glucose dehydrogenase